MERYYGILIQNAFIVAQNRIASALKKTAVERYNEFIEKYPHIERRVPDHQIASFLGITPQSLSRKCYGQSIFHNGPPYHTH
jgi:hypothetical protein